MSVLDRIAEDNIDLIKGEQFEGDGDDARMMMSRVISESLMTKKASYTFDRVPQQADVDMYQDAMTRDFWTIKKGHLMRLVSSIVKE